MTPQDILAIVGDLISDREHTKFPISTKLSWLNMCERELAKELLCLRRWAENVSIVAGTLEYNMSALIPGYTVLKIHRVKIAGKEIDPALIDDLKRYDQEWRENTEADPYLYAYDPLEGKFYIVPPVDSDDAADVDIEYSYLPINSITEDIKVLNVPISCHDAIIKYMIARSKVSDSIVLNDGRTIIKEIRWEDISGEYQQEVVRLKGIFDRPSEDKMFQQIPEKYYHWGKKNL